MVKRKTIVSHLDKEQIQAAVAAAEGQTQGEIVPVIVKQSDHYPAAHFRLAIFMALITPMIMYYLPWHYPDPIWYIWAQLPALLVGYLLAFHPSIKRFFSTSKELTEEVHQKALEIFFHQGLHTTQERTGIMIMISLLEHRVEILADVGINAKVEKDTWDKMLRPLIQQIKEGRPTEGICETIEKCGRVLREHFPRRGEDINELKNHLVTEGPTTAP